MTAVKVIVACASAFAFAIVGFVACNTPDPGMITPPAYASCPPTTPRTPTTFAPPPRCR
jgi:hypothetical protein